MNIDGLVTKRPIHVTWTAQTPRIGSDVDRRVARLWADACRDQPLHDSPILSFAGLDGARLQGCFVHYRYFIARRLAPELALDVEPIGVSGLVYVDAPGCRGYVIARRAMHLAQYPGFWDLFPAGGLDADSRRDDGSVDAFGQLLRELEEEGGVEADVVRDTRWVGLFRDAGDGIWNMCWQLTLSRPPAAGVEHDELRILDAGALRRFVAQERSVPPIVREIVRVARLTAEA